MEHLLCSKYCITYWHTITSKGKHYLSYDYLSFLEAYSLMAGKEGTQGQTQSIKHGKLSKGSKGGFRAEDLHVPRVINIYPQSKSCSWGLKEEKGDNSMRQKIRSKGCDNWGGVIF